MRVLCCLLLRNVRYIESNLTSHLSSQVTHCCNEHLHNIMQDVCSCVARSLIPRTQSWHQLIAMELLMVKRPSASIHLDQFQGTCSLVIIHVGSTSDRSFRTFGAYIWILWCRLVGSQIQMC